MGRVVDTAFGRMEVPIPEPWPSGDSVPIADQVADDFTIDTATYDNTIYAGKLKTVVFNNDGPVIAAAFNGDAFPRLIIDGDGSNYGLSVGNGTFDLADNEQSVSYNRNAGCIQLRGSAGDFNHYARVMPGALDSDGKPGILVDRNSGSGAGERVKVFNVRPATANGEVVTFEQLTALLSGQGFALPTADPHVAGRLWANAGVVTVSAG